MKSSISGVPPKELISTATLSPDVAHFAENLVHHTIGHPVSAHHPISHDAGLSMDADTDLDVVGADLEIVEPGLRQRTGFEGYAHGKCPGVGFSRRRLAFGETEPPVARGTCNLEDEEIAGDTAPAVPVFNGGGRNIVSGQNRSHLNATVDSHVRRHFEIHHVAGVVSVDEQDTATCGGGFRTFEDWARWWRREHVADSDGVREALADISKEAGFVAGAIADVDACPQPVQPEKIRTADGLKVS